MKVRAIGAAALGSDVQMQQALIGGAQEMMVGSTATLVGVEKDFGVYDLPFLFANEKEADTVLDGPFGQKLIAKLPAKGLVGLTYWENGFRNVTNTKRPITRFEDFQGIKLRVMQNPVFIDMFNSLGGSAVPMAWGETFTAVQQGTIDGLEIPLAVIEANKYFEVTKFLSLTNHTYSAIGLVISKRSLDKLPADLRKTVQTAATAAISAQRQAAAADARKTLATLESNGMKINPVSDVTAFRTSVKPVYDKFRQSGQAALLDKALAAVK